VKLSEHFDTSEFECKCGCGFGSKSSDTNPLLIEKLEAMRPLVGPIIVNSGCRCVKHNMEVGGSLHSAHTAGEAADLRCADSHRAFELVRYAFIAGFRRIGLERGCVHVDVSRDLTQDVLFLWQAKARANVTT
jgi:hypothetical protein